MVERVFHMKEGTEFPKSFAGTNLRFSVPDKPTSETDWDGFLAGVKASVDTAETAHALFVSAFALDRQKEAKEQANEEGMTPAKLQEWILGEGAKSVGKKLRGEGVARKPSGKQRAKILTTEYDDILSDPTVPEATKVVIRARRDRLAALGVEEAKQPEAPKPEATKKGSKK